MGADTIARNPAIYIGFQSGNSNVTGVSNTLVGTNSGTNLTASYNTFLGSNTGVNATDAEYNVFIGPYSGNDTTTGSSNIFLGSRCGFHNTTGTRNVYLGRQAGFASTTGGSNVYLGVLAGVKNETGSNNVFLGSSAGYNNINGNNNVFIGLDSGSNETGSNKLYIENSTSSSPLIYGEFDNDLLRVNGNLEIPWAGNDANPNHNIVALSGDNQGSGGSDVAFSLENKANTDKWTFRTYAPSRGFSISKIGTGGSEFKVDNPGTDMSTVVVKFAGVTVFKNGHLVNTSGNELTSLVQEQDKKIAMMEAKNAEMEAKISKLESLLTNLALDNSHTDKTKVSLNLK